MVYKSRRPDTFTPPVKDKVEKVINLNIGARGGGFSSDMTDSKDKILQNELRDLQNKGNELIPSGGSGRFQTADAELPGKTESESDNLEENLGDSNTTVSDPKGGAYGDWDGQGSIPVDHFEPFRTHHPVGWSFDPIVQAGMKEDKWWQKDRAGHGFSIPNYIGSDKSIIKPGKTIDSKTQWVIAPASEIGDIQGAYDRQSFDKYQNVLQKHWYDGDVNQKTYKSIVKNINENTKLTKSQKHRLLKQQEKKRKKYEKFSSWDSSPETTSTQNSEVFGAVNEAMYKVPEAGTLTFVQEPPKVTTTNKKPTTITEEYANGDFGNWSI